jgi:hypothetical protein
VSGPICEPKYNCGVHYITLCNAGPISRLCTVLARHLVPVQRSSCFLYVFISDSRNSLLENVNMEMIYQAFHFIFHFFLVLFAFFRMHFFFTRPFSSLLPLSYIYLLSSLFPCSPKCGQFLWRYKLTICGSR